MSNAQKRFIAFCKTLWTQLNRHDAAGLAAEMTYHWVLSLVPMLIFLLSLFGLLGNYTGLFVQLSHPLKQVVPADVYAVIKISVDLLATDSSEGLALLGLLAALWTASNGAWTIEKGLNRAYHQEGLRTRGFLQQRLVALGIVLGMAVIVLLCANLVIFGDVLLNGVERLFHLPLEWLRSIAFWRWALALGGLVVASAFIYTVAPEHRRQKIRRPIWPGAFVFVALWLIVSFGFNLYVANFGNYSRLYGPMGGVIVLMLWLYLTSYALLLGGEVNASLEK